MINHVLDMPAESKRGQLSISSRFTPSL